MEKGNLKLAIRYVKRIIEENKGKTPAEMVPGTKVYELERRAFQVGPVDKLKKNELPYGIIIISITGGHIL